MGLVLLRKGSQCLIGPVFTPFDPSTCVIIIKKKVKVNNCRRIYSYPMLSLMCNNDNLLWSLLKTYKEGPFPEGTLLVSWDV